MTSLAERFTAEVQIEFPSFEIRHKRSYKLQRMIDIVLRLVTLGGQRAYMTRYHTVLFGKLYVPDTWNDMSDRDRYILLRHERVHLEQGKRLGLLLMSFVYLIPFFPLGLAYGRARIEWEAYEETMRATWEHCGKDAVLPLKPWLVARFVGPDYGWMWPFPRTIERWFDEAMSRIELQMAEVASGTPGQHAG